MFEFVRRFRKWVMIGTVILVSFAFGITGVVYSVLAPSRDPGEEKVGSYSLSAVKGSDKTESVKRSEQDQFERRWDQFLIEHLNSSQMPFGRMMQQGGRGYQMAIRMMMRRAMQQNPFFRFIPYVQSKYGVDLIRNLLFLRSAEGGSSQDVVRMVPFNNENTEDVSQEQKVRNRQRHWSRESVWRLRYVLDLARNAGFTTTDQELADVIQPFLNRVNQKGKNRIGYRQFVEEQGRMSLEEFEKTLKEFVTILKFLSSISRSTAVEGAELLSGFDSEQGYGALLVTSIDHHMVRRNVFGSRDWRIRQRFLFDYPTGGYVDAFQNFSSNLGSENTSQPGQRGQNQETDTSSFEKRQFAYLYLPIDAYRESVDVPSEDRLRSYYQNNKSEEFARPGAETASSSGNGSANGNGEEGEDTDQYRPFDQVKEEIRETLIDQRALRKADADLKGLINSTISQKEIRGEPVNFRKIAKQADLTADLQYRESPLLDRDDMSHFLEQDKGVDQSHLDKITQVVYERELGSDGDAGPYPQEPVWFEEGVVLPRLVRVEADVFVSSSAAGESTSSMILSGFEETYPLPAMQLKEALQWRKLEQATSNQVEQVQQRLVRTYQSKRDQRWENIDVMGPPVPPQYLPVNASSSGDSDDTLSGDETNRNDSDKVSTWPPGTFRSEVVEQDLRYQKRRWQAAREVFTQVVQQTGLELQETKLFKLEDGPSAVDLQQSIDQRLTGNQNPRQRRRSKAGPADLFEPLVGTGENSSQIAILHKKLPKRKEDLKTFLDQQRRSRIMSERSSYLRTNVVTLLEQADLSLVNEEDETSSGTGSGQ